MTSSQSRTPGSSRLRATKLPFSPALGTLLVQDGKILDVGNIPIPSGARVVDAGGQSLIPGLVESHSHMGFKQLNIPATGSNNNELSVPVGGSRSLGKSPAGYLG